MDSLLYLMDKYCADMDMRPTEQREAMEIVIQRYLDHGFALDELTLPIKVTMVQSEKSIRKRLLTNDPHIGNEVNPYSMMEVVD